MGNHKRWMLGACAVFLPAMASAQLFKCKGPDGKIVYSDSRCEAAPTGALKVTPMGTTLSEREKAAIAKDEAAKADAAKAEADREAFRKAIPPGMVLMPAPTPAPVQKPYELNSSDNERLRNLEVNAGRAGAYAEQKSAFELESRSIRSGRDARMSSAERARRDAFHADLSSTDAKKRRDALQGLRQLYY